VWYDTDSLHLGDSLTFDISDGLKNCDYALVVLRPIYTTKKWCRREYAAIVHLESDEKKILLPIWHNISEDKIKQFDASLLDRIAIPSTRRLDDIILAIETGTWTGQKAREVGDPLRKEYSELADALADHNANERLSRNEQGVRLAEQELFHLFDVFEKRIDQIRGSMQIQKQRRNQGTTFRDHYPAVAASGRFRINVEIGYLNTYGNVTTSAKLVITLFAWPDDTPPMLAAVYGQRDQLRQIVFTPRFTVSEKVQWKNDEDASIHTSEQVVEIALTLLKDEIASRLDAISTLNIHLSRLGRFFE
jgi:hypothetical protein